jgi:sec-independent protein translocase protein TatB
MFDISFAEMLVIGVVALIVLGPERLPRVAHTLGHLFGRAQRYVNDVKNDIQREMELEELKKLKNSVEETARSIEEAAQTEIRTFENDMTPTENKVESTAADRLQSSNTPAADTPPDHPARDSVDPTQTVRPAETGSARPGPGTEAPGKN